MEANKSNDLRCQKKVSDRTGFHWYACGKPAKFSVTRKDERDYTPLLVCGLHANVMRRRGDRAVTPLTALQRVEP